MFFQELFKDFNWWMLSFGQKDPHVSSAPINNNEIASVPINASYCATFFVFVAITGAFHKTKIYMIVLAR